MKWFGVSKKVYLLFHLYQNHSFPKLGTEYTPQWRNIPNFDSSNHFGSGLDSKLFQFGSYFANKHGSISKEAKTMEHSHRIMILMVNWLQLFQFCGMESLETFQYLDAWILSDFDNSILLSLKHFKNFVTII